MIRAGLVRAAVVRFDDGTCLADEGAAADLVEALRGTLATNSSSGADGVVQRLLCGGPGAWIP